MQLELIARNDLAAAEGYKFVECALKCFPIGSAPRRDRRGSCSPCLASLSSVFFLLLLLLLPGNWFLALAIGIRDKIKINTHFAQLLEFQIPLLPQPLPPPLPLCLCLSCYRYCGELAIKMSGQFNTNKLSDSVCE